MTALRTATALVASILLALLTTGAGSAGVKPGDAKGAELVKTGWWWAGNETPLDNTALAPPQPSPPSVPKGALPVSAAGGEPEKLSALEFKLQGEPGSIVDSAVLVLRENSDPGANAAADTAKILACPITDAFWADGAGAAWKARPAYDCDLASAAGQRDAKTGLWTFDLTAVAAMWDTSRGGSASVALVEGADAPESFQVSFDGPAAKGIGFAFTFGEGSSDGSLAGLAALSPSGGGSSLGSPSSGSGASGDLGSTGSGAAEPLPATAEVAPVAEAPAAEASAATAPATTAQTTPVAAPASMPAWYAGIPKASYVLAPLTLGLAYLLMLAMGPDAQPAAGPARHGVSRALERLRAAGTALATRRKS